ncbi:hypothetical protein DNTS_022132 [Danionella cerebrum]|uniref:Uncharacterized protein n=1 Tax=Danionella cerebrum TaxID=2873325 RepID=A0A553R0M9_9TELE|nr:hypothetical protein DNTS_022132 [Danionella translucida]
MSGRRRWNRLDRGKMPDRVDRRRIGSRSGAEPVHPPVLVTLEKAAKHNRPEDEDEDEDEDEREGATGSVGSQAGGGRFLPALEPVANKETGEIPPRPPRHRLQLLS